MRHAKEKQLLRITWTDNASLVSDGKMWYTEEEIKKLAKKTFNELITTVAFLIEKTDEYIVIAASYEPVEKSYADASLIPIGNIVSIKKIK